MGVYRGRLARSEERSEARSEARSEEKEFRNIGDEQDQRSKPEEQARVEVGAIVSSLVDRAEQVPLFLSLASALVSFRVLY